MKQSRASTNFVTSKGEEIEIDGYPRQIFPSTFASITSYVIIHCSNHKRAHGYPLFQLTPEWPDYLWFFTLLLPYFLKPFIDKARKNSKADRRHAGKIAACSPTPLESLDIAARNRSPCRWCYLLKSVPGQTPKKLAKVHLRAYHINNIIDIVPHPFRYAAIVNSLLEVLKNLPVIWTLPF